MCKDTARRPARARGALAVCGAVLLAACASKYAQVPPRVDLRPHGRVGLIVFASAEEHQAMGTLATQRFAEALLASQPGIELLELTESDSLIRAHPRGTDPVVLAQALGQSRDIPVVFVGELVVSGIKPRARLEVTDVSLRASVSAKLAVRLLSTRAGGTLWRSSSTATGNVGRVNLAGGLPSVAIRDTEEAYGELVGSLVEEVTADLRPTWQRQ
ncbi:MAG TPA: hypothetical protein VH680_09755 [Gemmatimonadales bacterium]